MGPLWSGLVVGRCHPAAIVAGMGLASRYRRSRQLLSAGGVSTQPPLLERRHLHESEHSFLPKGLPGL